MTDNHLEGLLCLKMKKLISSLKPRLRMETMHQKWKISINNALLISAEYGI